MAAKTYRRTGRIAWSPLTTQQKSDYATVSAYTVGDIFTTDLGSAETFLLAEGVIQALPDDGEVLTADHTQASGAHWAAGGGGGGVNIPQPFRSAAGTDEVFSVGVTGEANDRLIAHADGSLHWGGGFRAPQIALVVDDSNNGDNALAFFVPSGAFGPTLSLYDEHINFDGSTTTPAASYILMGASPTGGIITLSDRNGAGEATLTIGGDDSVAHSYYGKLKLVRDSAATAANGLLALQIRSAGADKLTADYAGVLKWSGDTTLQRQAAGVLEIPQAGGGLKLTSPDGSKTKTLTIDNSGALALV